MCSKCTGSEKLRRRTLIVRSGSLRAAAIVGALGRDPPAPPWVARWGRRR